ncbi:MAG: rhamnulokinase family protein [Planctomycetota bacterium]
MDTRLDALGGPLHLAIDLGASGGRVIAGGLAEDQLQMVLVHRFVNQPVRWRDGLFWNHLSLWHEITTGLRLAVDQDAAAASSDRSPGFSRFASVGVDSWGVDYGLVDANDQLISPLRHYRDPRHQGMTEVAFEMMSREAIFGATGLQFMDINTLYQLVAAQRAGDVAMDAATGFMMVADLFHWMLTGVRSVESTNASTSQMLDPQTGSWSTKIIDTFNLPMSWFPEPLQAGTTLGTIESNAADLTGLCDVPVIAPATHDTGSAVIAVPARDFAPAQPEWCYISSGTWSLMGVELPAANLSDRCRELNFTNEGGVQGSTRLLKNIGGLWIFQQIRAALQRRGNAPSWEDMIREAEVAEPFALLINPDDPSLSAPLDMIDAIETFASRTGQASPQALGILYRASLEGLALRYRQTLDDLESLVGNVIHTIHIVGGGSQNRLLCQMTADACDRAVIAGPTEATAIGNLLMQMIGGGQVSGLATAREIVRRSFPVETYEPRQPDAWHAAAERFTALVS